MRKATVFVSVLVALCLVGGIAGCSSAGGEVAAPQASQVESDVDPVLEGKNADARVVALSRSIGELWLLAGGQLVGVSDDALDLEGLSADAASVGSLSRPSLEQVVALEPDFVMLNDDLPSHKKLHAALEEAGVPVLVVDVNSFEDYKAMMSQLVQVTGRDDLYERAVAQVETEIGAVKASAPQPEGVSYLALRTSATKNKVLKSDYFACAMLDELGLANVASDSSALDDLSIEAIAQADPTWVFVVYQGEDAEAQQAFEEAFSSNPIWAELSATKEGRVVVLPKELFQYKPNARWAEAYAYLVRIVEDA